jgi:hypothetical protein
LKLTISKLLPKSTSTAVTVRCGTTHQKDQYPMQQFNIMPQQYHQQQQYSQQNNEIIPIQQYEHQPIEQQPIIPPYPNFSVVSSYEESE